MTLLDRNLLIGTCLLAALATAGCGGDDDDGAADGDADGDADSDTDADSDADSDADGDTDADTDADADADGDADVDCSTENAEDTCTDGLDNNGNGFTDCTDFCCTRNVQISTCTVDAAVQDVRQGNVDENTVVRLSNMIVTAVDGTSWYMQASDAESPDYSGIYAYVPNTNPDGITIPEVGDLVTVEGEYAEFYGFSELSYLHEPEQLASTGDLPAPVAVAPEDVGDEDGTAGPRAEPLESVLITTNGAVTSITPAAGQGDHDPTNEFVVDDVLRVDDRMYFADPAEGNTISLVGTLYFGNEHFKLEPRDAADVEIGAL
jgi:predicted extracellular nuclease